MVLLPTTHESPAHAYVYRNVYETNAERVALKFERAPHSFRSKSRKRRSLFIRTRGSNG